MNTLSCGEFCCLFCCPPFPTSIASKLAFLPPEPTYSVDTEDKGASYMLHLSDRAEFQYSKKELDCIEVFKARNKRGNKICVMFVRCAVSGKSQYTLLFSHGNAVDLGQMSSFFIGLGTRLKINICSYDYSGYGVSEGKPSEKNIYHDIDTAYFILRTRYNQNPENIILYGQSIGTVPTVDLASRYHELAAVILHSPLMSGLRVACPENQRTCCCDSFVNIDKIDRIKSPLLVIHGTDDEVIDFSHGLEIYDKAPVTVEPLWVEGAGHNDVELYGAYLERIRKLLDTDLPKLYGNDKKQDNDVTKKSRKKSST